MSILIEKMMKRMSKLRVSKMCESLTFLAMMALFKSRSDAYALLHADLQQLSKQVKKCPHCSETSGPRRRQLAFEKVDEIRLLKSKIFPRSPYYYEVKIRRCEDCWLCEKEELSDSTIEDIILVMNQTEKCWHLSRDALEKLQTTISSKLLFCLPPRYNLGHQQNVDLDPVQVVNEMCLL